MQTANEKIPGLHLTYSALRYTCSTMPKTETVRLDGATLTALRRRRLLTRAEFAARAGVSDKTSWLAEASRPIGLRKARAIATALRVSLRRLVLTPVGNATVSRPPADAAQGAATVTAA